MQTILNVQELKIHYKTLRGYAKAVDNVSFAIRDGEILGVAGESGCGKSTLGNSLVIVKQPMYYISGAALYEEQNLYTALLPQAAKLRFKKIALIPQYALDAFSPTKKLKVVIRDLLREHHLSLDSQIQTKLAERLKLVKLSPAVLDKFPGELSGGMKQRLIMVISTLLDPQLLIADEVTSALDVTTQRYVAEMLVNFRDQKIIGAMLFITHDLAILYEIADRIMVMYGGQVLELAPTEDLINAPKHPYTKALIAALPRPGLRFREQRLEGIPGYPPSLIGIRDGCRFRERCRFKNATCEREHNPPLEHLSDEHAVACWNWQDLKANGGQS